MEKSTLAAMQKEEVLDFIRGRLAFKDGLYSQLRHTDMEVFKKKEHRRFNMSGYEAETGQCTKHNLAIVNEFADLGIYDYTSYLFLDFYKGHGTLYLKYFHEGEDLEFEFGGYGTSEIIYEIFQYTIFSGKGIRRRS